MHKQVWASRAQSVMLGCCVCSVSPVTHLGEPQAVSPGRIPGKCLSLCPCCPPWRQSTPPGTGELVCPQGQDWIPAVPPGVSIQMRNGLITPVQSGLFQEPLKPRPCLLLPRGMCCCLPGVRTHLPSNSGREKGFSSTDQMHKHLPGSWTWHLGNSWMPTLVAEALPGALHPIVADEAGSTLAKPRQAPGMQQAHSV